MPGAAVRERTAGGKRLSQRKPVLSPEKYVDGILKGDRSALAKAITLIESSREDDRDAAEYIIERCLRIGGDSIRVGITGAPGAGKSSLIEAVGKHIIEERGQSVAVLAVDPTSRVSGGSILGDKTRMKYLATSERAFIRPSPSRSAQGGVAQHTREAMLLCEAAGYGNILIETVGVGQSEVSVRDMVDFFLLVMIPGAGDELQGIKRGVMELVDAVVVNKADGDGVRAAERARAQAENGLHYFPLSGSGWSARSLACSAYTGKGIAELWACVLEHRVMTQANGWLAHLRLEQNRNWMQETLEEGLMQMFRSNPVVQERMAELERQVLAGQKTAFRAGHELLSSYRSEGRSAKPSFEVSTKRQL
jgi:LAO/AO transport system kinase